MYKRNKQGWVKHLDFILLDALILQLSYVIAYRIRLGSFFPYSSDYYLQLSMIMTIVDIFIAATYNTMHNVLKRSFFKETSSTAKQCVIVFSIMTVFLFATKSSELYSRIVLFLTFGIHFFLSFATRQLWKKVLKRVGVSKTKTKMILVAPENMVGEILKHANPADEFEYAGLVLTDRNGTGEEIMGLKAVADLENAADYFCREWVDEVFIYPRHMHDLEPTKSTESEGNNGVRDRDTEKTLMIGNMEIPISNDINKENGTVYALIEQCRQMSIPVHIRLPIESTGGKSFIEKIGGYNVLTKSTNYASPNQLFIKRVIDLLGGFVGCVLTLLVLLFIGPMIKIVSPGPILFKQTRIGQNGKKFTMYKLRTMYTDAEERKAELMAQNRVSDGMMFKMDFDPRIIGNKIVDGKQVTGLGEFLRKTSIDELPQLFNVLKGEMSLVGTRPPTVDEWDKYKYHHRARLSTKPGITGMWQVSGRSSITDFEEVVRLDTEYINNWSIGLDIKILFQTVKVVLKHDGAM